MTHVAGPGFGMNGGFWVDQQGARFRGTAMDAQAGRLDGMAVFGRDGFVAQGQALGPGGPVYGGLQYDAGRDMLNLSFQSPFGMFQGALPVPDLPPPPPPPPPGPGPRGPAPLNGLPPAPPPPNPLAFLNQWFPGLIR